MNHWLPKSCPGPDPGPSAPCLPSVIILAVLEGVLLLMLIFLRQRICIAIALLKEASRSGLPGKEKGQRAKGRTRKRSAGKVAGQWRKGGSIAW